MTDNLVARLGEPFMTDDLVKRLLQPVDDPFFGPLIEPIKKEAADRIEWMQDIIARIQYTNLRRDINAESRMIEIEKLCKGEPKWKAI